MRKTCVVLCILVLFICSSGLLLGSGIDNKTNWSTGYIRTLNRNAVYDNPDAVVYNPAGVVKLDPGFNIGVHNQFLFKDYSHTSSPSSTTYSATNPTWLLPSAFLTYNFERWAVYGAFYISGGGGKLDYKDGIVDINEGIGLSVWDPNATFTSLYYTGAAGGVFAINDMFSIAASGKFVFGNQKIDIVTANPVIGHPMFGDMGTEIVHVKQDAMGFGGVFGLNVAIPAMETNIGVRYETKVKLEWEVTESGGALGPVQYPKGAKNRQDLPGMLAIGASIKPFTALRTEASFTYYFNKESNWEGLEKNVTNGWEIGAMAEYAFIPEVLGSVGVLYADPGADEDSYFYINPALKSFSVGGGVLWYVKPAIALELGVLKPFYFDDDGYSETSIPVSLSKSLWIVAIGASFHI